MSDIIVNKVAESALITINLEDYYPTETVMVFDLKDFLFMGLILKEKDFREALKNHDWLQYEGKIVAVTCTVDAIIPMWAYMLAASYLQPSALNVFLGSEQKVKEDILINNIRKINPLEFTDKRIVVKGCGDLPITESAYLEITKLLHPVVKSIMYGEPCSTVPIYKKK